MIDKSLRSTFPRLSKEIDSLISAGLTWHAIKDADRTGHLSQIELKIAEDNAFACMVVNEFDFLANARISGIANELHIGRLSPIKIEISDATYFLKEDFGCYEAMERIRGVLKGTKNCIPRIYPMKVERRRLVIQQTAERHPPPINGTELLEELVVLCLFMAMFNINDGVADNVGWIDGSICLFDLETCFQPARLKGEARVDRLNLLIDRTGVLEIPQEIIGVGTFRGSLAATLGDIWPYLTKSKIEFSVSRAVTRALSDIDAVLIAGALLRQGHIRPRVAIRPTATYGLLCNRMLSLEGLFAGYNIECELRAALEMFPAWPESADFALAINSEVRQIMMGGLPIFHSHPETCDLLFGDTVVSRDFFVENSVDTLSQSYADLTNRDSKPFLISLLIDKVTMLRDYFMEHSLTISRKDT